jgi:glycosyltransferase involved in cell wall biosynthesis
MAKISAIISAYYAEDFLEGRLENLEGQTGVDLEIVVVCEKGSVEHKIAKRYSPILTKGIPSIYEAWNLGIKAASGEYLTNANCDDRLYPGALASLAEVLDNYPNVAVAYGWDDIVRTIMGDPISRHVWPQGDFEDLLLGCFIGPMPMWRASLHDKYGLFDANYLSAGDYEFWMRVTQAGEYVKLLPMVIGAYCRRDDNLERREAMRSIWETGRARGKYLFDRRCDDK